MQAFQVLPLEFQRNSDRNAKWMPGTKNGHRIEREQELTLCPLTMEQKYWRGPDTWSPSKIGKSTIPVYCIFKACFNCTNAAGCILLIAELKDSPWRVAHVWRFSLTEFSKDHCLIGSENLIWRRAHERTYHTWSRISSLKFSASGKNRRMLTCLFLYSLLGIVPSPWNLLELILSPLQLLQEG